MILPAIISAPGPNSKHTWCSWWVHPTPFEHSNCLAWHQHTGMCRQGGGLMGHLAHESYQGSAATGDCDCELGAWLQFAGGDLSPCKPVSPLKNLEKQRSRRTPTYPFICRKWGQIWLTLQAVLLLPGLGEGWLGKKSWIELTAEKRSRDRNAWAGGKRHLVWGRCLCSWSFALLTFACFFIIFQLASCEYVSGASRASDLDWRLMHLLLASAWSWWHLLSSGLRQRCANTAEVPHPAELLLFESRMTENMVSEERDMEAPVPVVCSFFHLHGPCFSKHT